MEHTADPNSLRRTPEARRVADPEVEYPSSYGLALQGTLAHSHALNRAWIALERHFRTERTTFIAKFFALYFNEGDPKRCIYPDLMVARGVVKSPQVSYRIWKQPVPQFVLEVASRSTKDRDLGFKMDQYQRLGVREYWQLDQTGCLLSRPLVGHSRRHGRLQELHPSGTEWEVPRYRSEALGLLLRVGRGRVGLKVVFTDPRTGEDVLDGGSLDAAPRKVEDARKARSAARVAAERRVRKAEEARVAAERRAQTAEELVAKYRALLRKAGQGSPD